MKINNQYSSYRETYHSQASSEATDKDKVVSKKESVEINLSSASQQIRLTDQVKEIDNSQKIADIKKAIEEGTYEVSSKELADKMFTNLKGRDNGIN